MKRCPQCSRTYSDDTFAFCLADGSLLSAPFDSDKTQFIPASHRTHLPPTEILQPQSKSKVLPKRQRQKKFFCKSKDARAEGELISKGFIVYQGAKCSKYEAPSIGKSLSDLRKKLIDSGTLKLEGNTYKLTVDYIFSSPSAAAGVVLGREASGWTEWKTKGGITLDEVKRQSATKIEESQDLQAAPSDKTSTQKLYLEFWNKFIDFCNAEGTFLQLHRPSARSFYGISMGRSNVAIALTASIQKRRLGCEMYIMGADAKRNLKLIEKDKQAIEAKTGGLDWQELPEKQDCRIVLYRPDVDISDKSNWNAAFAWLKSEAELFLQTFSPLVSALPR